MFVCELDEWKNLQKRINDPKFNYSDADKEEATCHWASYRGQTLSRTGPYENFEVYLVVD